MASVILSRHAHVTLSRRGTQSSHLLHIPRALDRSQRSHSYSFRCTVFGRTRMDSTRLAVVSLIEPDILQDWLQYLWQNQGQYKTCCDIFGRTRDSTRLAVVSLVEPGTVQDLLQHGIFDRTRDTRLAAVSLVEPGTLQDLLQNLWQNQRHYKTCCSIFDRSCTIFGRTRDTTRLAVESLVEAVESLVERDQGHYKTCCRIFGRSCAIFDRTKNTIRLAVDSLVEAVQSLIEPKTLQDLLQTLWQNVPRKFVLFVKLA